MQHIPHTRDINGYITLLTVHPPTLNTKTTTGGTNDELDIEHGN